MSEDALKRYDVPPVKVLKDGLDLSDEQAHAVHWIIRAARNHEQAFTLIDALLDGYHGAVALDGIEDADAYTDEGIGMCPPFSYLNAGDTYITTLGRDHENGKWVVACWGDMLEDYEREHKLGDHREWEEEPERCPCCHGTEFDLKHFPNSARGPSYSWVCASCNQHCYAVEGYEPTVEEEEDVES